ncbi:MAG: hypothetical protein ACKVS5_04840 [Parvularculaceae bacterium]
MNKHFAFLLVSAMSLSSASVLAQTVVTQSAGRMTVTTPNADQSVKIEVGPLAGTVRLFSFPGIVDGAQFSGVSGLTVQTGSGFDKVEAKVDLAQSFDLRIDTGSGDSENKVVWEMQPGAAAATIDIASATTGRQLASVEVESDASRAAVTMRAPNATEFVGKVSSGNTSDFMRAVVATGAAKSSFDLTAEAGALEVMASGGNSAAANELKYVITQKRPAPVSTVWDIRGSNLTDKIEIKTSANGATATQTGLVRGFGGDDFIQMESEAFSTVTGMSFVGDAGADQISQFIKGRFQNSQTLQSSLSGNDGDDVLVSTTDTGIFGTGLPNDREQIIDCGAGNDRFNAFGVIISCESRL